MTTHWQKKRTKPLPEASPRGNDRKNKTPAADPATWEMSARDALHVNILETAQDKR